MPWTRALDLIQWADRIEAPDQFPRLIRRLIKRTVSPTPSVNFPADEQIRRPGFDGIVEAVQGNQYVPSGRSRWELGVGKTPKDKAEEDFKKRTLEIPSDDQKQTVFVFVTPRAWEGANDWAKKKAKQSSWRDVAAYDANDLEQWLESATDIDLWFAQLTGRANQDIQDLDSYWLSVRSIAEHPLTESIFTVSREDEIASVKKWLSSPPASFFMRTNGLTDAIDFLAALGSQEGMDRLQNGLIIYSTGAWRQLAARSESLVLIAAPSLQLQSSDTAGAVTNGHYVFLSGTHGIIDADSETILRRQDYYALTEALLASGFSDSQAQNLGKASCGSSSILKRLISKHPQSDFPLWSQPEQRQSLAPFALIGGWANVDPALRPRPAGTLKIGSDPPVDVTFVCELVGHTREQLDAVVGRWLTGKEPLFVRFANSVLLSSREDSWHLLGGGISEEHLNRFQDIAQLVLEEDNPAFELPREKRWMADLYGKRHSLSGDLRKSFIETLALMAVFPPKDPILDEARYTVTVRRILERVLPQNATWQRWASFGSDLSLLAEADPQLFLDRVETDLGSSQPMLSQLFQDQSNHAFNAAIHSGLLWALETLAWSDEYLLRVAVCLTRLAAQDPGGNYANRPANSLKEIFLLWLWHTNANLDERLRALTAVLHANPTIGWKLLRDLLPSGASSISHNTQLPRWRQWADGWSRSRLHPQVRIYALAVADLTIRAAGEDCGRWSQIVEPMLRVDATTTEKVFSVLEDISRKPREIDDGGFQLWTQLRNILARHERHADANWAFGPEIRNRIDLISQRLAPDDIVLKNQWLFDQRAQLQGWDLTKDFQKHFLELQNVRRSALQEIISQLGASGVHRLLDLAVDSNSVGWIIGDAALLDATSAGLPAILESKDAPRQAFVNAYIRTSLARRGWEFVQQLPISTWSVQQAVAFACCLPFDRDTWKWLETLGPMVVETYWKTIRPFLGNPKLDDVIFAAASFLDVGMGGVAIDMLSQAHLHRVALPSELLAVVLERALQSSAASNAGVLGDIHYSIQQLVRLLQSDQSFDQIRLARIEWAYLPVLEPEFSEAGPSTLVKMVLADPHLFVDLLVKIFRDEHTAPSEQPLSEDERFIASSAHRLLDGLRDCSKIN